MDIPLHSIDIAIIAGYLVAIIAMGWFLSKRASKDMNAYFLGGKSIHWLGLAMSGSVSNFDITGTMWIIFFICVGILVIAALAVSAYAASCNDEEDNRDHRGLHREPRLNG